MNVVLLRSMFPGLLLDVSNNRIERMIQHFEAMDVPYTSARVAHYLGINGC